ncbi:MAG: hypothetical protein A3F83_08605 [Candidatus Glassbacteria bacterium RIFCSPLOWO2_12_FULL_58_11]|uniref:Diguanylate cyclase n=2 Tax=Candidatus Glassiibacteriota TaxID=1817805 RepID=A0A1F5YPP8_9BACT|nr:MAG: hypothetical protein A2Z86_11575 [Candidatus Glassbacteria bacterium GWA2_58_10]OGG01957.1 MAG: hypothetical protein A3F83_08605 [Candidatus Glassbacteria bacterium RIFCSPLOWO2_12_FULL_58_11]
MSIDEDYYRNLLDKLFDGIFCVDRNRTITFWNKSAENISGYSISEVVGRVSCREIVAQTNGAQRTDSGEPPQSILEQTLNDGVAREGEYYIKHKEGHRVPVACKVEPIHDARGQISGAVQIFHDNSSRVAARSVIEKLRKLALIDPLTGLANRRYIDKILEGKTDEMKRYGMSFGVLFIDIDHFKQVNDHYGHEMGDKVLWTISRGMSIILRSSDVLGRWGGEEFVAVVLNVDREGLMRVAEKMRSEIEKIQIQENGQAFNVTISIGATLVEPGTGMDKNLILKKADELLYVSKNNGRNRVTLE